MAKNAIPTLSSGLASSRRAITTPRGMLLIGKAALDRGLPFDDYAYPVYGIPHSSSRPEVEKSVVYAIARQESAFNPGRRLAGARPWA